MHVRFELGTVAEEEGGFSGSGGWSYVSPPYAVAQENTVQTFTLPQPVLSRGGSLRVHLLGRSQVQLSDAQFYVCIAHVKCLGTPLYGWQMEEAELRAPARSASPLLLSQSGESSATGGSDVESD